MAVARPIILCVSILGSFLGTASSQDKSLPESPQLRSFNGSSPVEAIRMLSTLPSGRMWVEMTKTTIAEVIERSSTFSELMDRLAAAPDVLLYMALAELEGNGFVGRSRFEVAPRGVIVAHIQINAFLDQLRRRVRGVAHELAHTFEVMCLRPYASTQALRDTLVSRAVVSGRGNAVETRFAHDVETVVFAEWLEASPGKSRLEEIARRHGLTRCNGRDDRETLSASAPPSNSGSH